MNLVALPAFSDKYIWLLHDGVEAVVVGPGDAAPVHAALNAERLTLAAILVTHHHPDDVGGDGTPAADFAPLREWKSRNR